MAEPRVDSAIAQHHKNIVRAGLTRLDLDPLNPGIPEGLVFSLLNVQEGLQGNWIGRRLQSFASPLAEAANSFSHLRQLDFARRTAPGQTPPPEYGPALAAAAAQTTKLHDSYPREYDALV